MTVNSMPPWSPEDTQLSLAHKTQSCTFLYSLKTYNMTYPWKEISQKHISRCPGS